MEYSKVKQSPVGRLMIFLNCIAIKLVGHTVNLTCYWIFHQPEEPEEAKKFRKF